MRKPKGVGLHDTLYYKIQKTAIKAVIDENKIPVVTQWSEKSYYITSDRITFYILPIDKYCLRSEWIYSCEKLFNTDKHYVQELYNENPYKITLTGNRFAANPNDPETDVILELQDIDEKVYISERALELFPKQKSFYSFGKNSPILVISSLDTILGGVWPIKSFTLQP